MSASPSNPVQSFVRDHPVGTYLLLAFALSWCIWPLTLLNPDSSPLVPFGPALAAIAVATLSGGLKGLTSLLRGFRKVRAGAGWYLTAVALPAAILGGAFLRPWPWARPPRSGTCPTW